MAEGRTEHSSILTKGYIVAAAAVAAVFLAIFCFRSFTTPTQIEEPVTIGSLKQEVAFEHGAVPRVSALYPSPGELRNQATYFTQITDRFFVSVKADLATEPEMTVTGTSQVILNLKAGELWSRDYILEHQKEFEGRGECTVIDGTFGIPLADILAFTKQVEEETRVTPNNGYTLSVTPVINARTRETGEPLVTEFSPAYTIELTQREIRPTGEPVRENTASLTETRLVPGTVGALGLQVPVIPARYGSAALTVSCGGLILLMLRQRRRNSVPMSEVEMINRRYRNRMVTASKGVIEADASVIHLESFKELLKIADETDKSIIRLQEFRDGAKVFRYCIPDGKTLYCYTASDTRPDDPPQRRSLRERVITARSLADQPLPEEGVPR